MFGTPSFDEFKKAAEAARLEQEEKAKAFQKARELGPLDLDNKTLRTIKLTPVRKVACGEIFALCHKHEEMVKSMLAEGASFGDIARRLQHENRVAVLAQSVNDYCKMKGLERKKTETAFEKMEANADEVFARLVSGEPQYVIAKSLGFTSSTFNRMLKRIEIRLIGDRWIDERKGKNV